jgi:hypothetical protein
MPITAVLGLGIAVLAAALPVLIAAYVVTTSRGDEHHPKLHQSLSARQK